MSFDCDKQNDLTRQAKLLEFANLNRNAGNFNDVTIQAGAESISANRMVLACYSKFFESMFLSQIQEEFKYTVEIKEFDGQAIRSVIEYIYTGKIDINANNVMALLGAADFLQVDEVKKMCFDYLETSLTVDNCIDIMKATFLYNIPSSCPQIHQFIHENFDEIMKKESFKELSKQDLMPLLVNLDRCTVQESSLYRAIINWVKYKQNRCTEFSSLFLILDLQKLSTDFLLNMVAAEPLVQASKDCLDAISSNFKAKEARQQRGKASKILCVGRIGRKTFFEVYNYLGKPPSKYANFPQNLIIHCVLKLDDFVYCIGEQKSYFPLSIPFKTYRLNLNAANSQWEEIASMKTRRCDFAAAAWNGKIVVTGGYNNATTLNSAELYNRCSNKWKNIAPMICARDEHALVVANNKLFAIGGLRTSYNELASVEQLDNEKGKWKQIKSMNKPRTSFAAVTCNNFIYAIDGLSSNNAVKTVERYDLDKDDWSFVKSMNVERIEHLACVLNGKIFVVGGKDGHKKAVRTIDCYDPAINNWVVAGETEQDFYRHAIVTI